MQHKGAARNARENGDTASYAIQCTYNKNSKKLIVTRTINFVELVRVRNKI